MRAESLGRWLAVVAAACLATGCATTAPLRGSGGTLEPAPHASRAPVSQRGSGGAWQGAPSASGFPEASQEERLRRRHPVRMPVGTAVDVGDMGVLAAETGLLEVDAFEKLLVYAGLDPAEDLPPRVNPLTPEEAARTLALLLQKPVTLGNFPPRMAAAHLLREVLVGGGVSRGEMLRRVERFRSVAVLRPDGALAWMRDGRTQQRVAPVELGALPVHDGRRADAGRRQADDPPHRDVGHCLGHHANARGTDGRCRGHRASAVPLRTGRAGSRTHRSASGTVRVGAQRRPWAALILHRANTATQGSSPAGGPGQWGPAKESMTPHARRYQEQITEHTGADAYWVGGMSTQVGGVKFDGFKNGVLLEAKGPGYAKFFEDLAPKDWFRHSGAQGLIGQAERQAKKVRGMGIPIEWHVAEKQAADAIQRLLRNARVEGIKVVHTPAR